LTQWFLHYFISLQGAISPTFNAQLLHAQNPKSAKKWSSSQSFLRFWDLRMKTAHKMLVKSTPGLSLFLKLRLLRLIYI
jgi:hypothetical protein